MRARDKNALQYRAAHLKAVYGEVAEWLKAPAWKVGIQGNLYRGFESLSLRHIKT